MNKKIKNIINQSPRGFDVSTLDTLVCPNCSNQTMVQAQIFKLLPAFHPANPQGKEVQVAVSTLMCTQCGMHLPNPSMLKKEVRVHDNRTEQ